MTDIINILTVRAEAISRHWRLPHQVPQLLKYRENAVFMVRLPGGGKAALRLHRPDYHSAAALASELVWMASLRQSGIPVPEPLPTEDDRLLVHFNTEDGKRQYADLIGWVEGEPLGESGTPLIRSGSELQMVFSAIGRQMARLHQAADDFTVPAGFERPVWDAAGILGDAPFWGRFWDCPGLDKDDAIFLTRLRQQVRDRLNSVVPSLDYGMIHADIVRENVIVQGTDIAFIDFDDCGFGFRLFDLATTLLRNRREPDYPLIKAALLDGYAIVRPQMRAEFQHLPLFLLLRSLTYIGWAGARTELPDTVERLRRYVAEVKELAAEQGFAATS